MKRISWFVAGAATGIAGTAAAKRKVKQTAERLAPGNVAREAVGKVRDRAQHVIDAVREGRVAMEAKERELRALRDGHPVRPQQTAGGLAGGVAIEATEVHDLDTWRRRAHDRRRARP
jgi:hypothetical protein